VESCLIVSWKKKTGDQVSAGEVLCEVETDKAAFEVESPAAGVLLAIFFEAGSDVPVLTNIAAVGTPGENADALRPGGVPKTAATGGPAVTPAASPAIKSAPPLAGGRIAASPRARALAARMGVTLAGLNGSGPGGRIMERDVKEGAGSAASAAAPVASASAPRLPGAITEIQVKGVRKLIAERMHASLQGTAQLTLHSSADARCIQRMRKSCKEAPEDSGLRNVTINDMVLFATARTLAAFPNVNALFTGDRIQQYADVHLAFAVDTPKGLLVPVIRGANLLGLKALAREAARLAAACKDGSAKPDELSGGTFTVSNLGSMGVEQFTPILNAPQVAILGVGSIVLRPELEGGAAEAAFVPRIGLSLTIDHQAVDGAPGAVFLHALADAIARFDLLLMR